MTYARSEIFNSQEIGTYHCVSRCVRRAFLCGFDASNNRSYEHRREWIRNRLKRLVECFSIEVIAYAVMNNHLHCLIKNRPDQSSEWSAEEVARRWRMLFPLRRIKGVPAKPNESEIKAITNFKDKVELYRERLSSISWFNRCLNENIARRANIEDECSGRFWEGRFKCQRVFDVSGIIACSAYIDLNPIRAGMARTLESSDHTSIQDRIHKKTSHRPIRCKNWAKIPLVSIAEATENCLNLDDYLKLVDETGRIIVHGKKSISDDIAPIIERLKIDPDKWVETTNQFKKLFKRMVGPEKDLRLAAKKARKNWFAGISNSKMIFTERQANKAQ